MSRPRGDCDTKRHGPVVLISGRFIQEILNDVPVSGSGTGLVN